MKRYATWLYVVGGIFVVLVGFGVYLNNEEAKEIARADKLYSEGNKQEAIKIYTNHSARLLRSDGSGRDAIRRVVEYEVANAHTAEAKKWIEQALDKNLEITYDSAEAKTLLESINKERAAKEEAKRAEQAQREAELKKKREEQEEAKRAEQARREEEEKERNKPVIATAEQIHQDYEENEAAADQKFKGKVVQFTGTIDKIDKDAIWLNSGKEFEIRNPYAAVKDKAELVTLRKGQPVTLQGTCTGKGALSSVNFKDCIIVQK